MPWSAKAQELLRTQYAAVGAAAESAAAASGGAIAEQETRSRRLDGEKPAKIERVMCCVKIVKKRHSEFVAAYRQYCWPVESLTDLKLAPFHLLATEGHVHTDKDHAWHMETLAEVCRADSRTAAGDAVQGRGRDRPGQAGRRESRGGRADGPGRRRDGRQAARLHPSGAGGLWPSPP